MASPHRFLAALVALLVACGGDSSSEPDAASGDAAPGADAPAADAAPPVARTMYVSTGDGQRLAVVRLEVDGTMTAIDNSDLDLGANTGAMAFARSARRLYLGAGANIITIALAGDGTPSVVGNTPNLNTGNPTYLGLTADESFMVSAYFGNDVVKAHNVSGAPPHAESDSVATLSRPHASLRGPADRFFVPHRDDDQTHAFTVSATGELSLVDQVTVMTGLGPRHIAFTPDESFAYVVNEFDSSVTAHSVGGDGALTVLDTVTALPAGFMDQNTGADIHVSPDGQFVYSSNRGHNSIAMFSIGAGGELTPLGHAATETTPREFDVSPDGRFVVVCGQGSGFLQSYAVESDGRLTAIAGAGRLDVGGDLRWVIIE